MTVPATARRLAAVATLALLLAAPAMATRVTRAIEGQAGIARRAATLADADARRAGVEAARAAARVTDALARVAAADTAVAEARARLAAIARARADRAGRLARRRAPVARLLAALQSLARRPAVLALAGPGSTADLIHVRLTLAAVVPVIEARTAALRAEIAASDRLRDAARRTLATLAAARSTRDGERRTLARLAAASADAAAAADLVALGRSDRVLALAADLDEARAADRRDRRDRDAAALLATLPPPPPRPGPADATLPRSGWRLPVAGTLTTGFGEAMANGLRSRGLTLDPAPGAIAVAPAPGRIGYVGEAPGVGPIVIIVHPRGWTTLVAGLARPAVAAGRLVRRGDPLGPATGPVTIEVRRDGRVMDAAALAQRR